MAEAANSTAAVSVELEEAARCCVMGHGKARYVCQSCTGCKGTKGRYQCLNCFRMHVEFGGPFVSHEVVELETSESR